MNLSTYLAIKYLHVGAAVISYGLFFIRGVWMLRESPRLAQRWVRIVPHVNDTLLFGAAVALVAGSDSHAWTAPWLLAKITALVLYILIGMVALHGVAAMRVRAIAWIAAQMVFLYIVSVAVTKRALVFV